MLKRVLVGLNGSEYSRAAGELCVEWAEWYQASITALGVIDLPNLTGPQAVPLGASAYKVHRDETVVSAAHQRIATVLAEFQARCAGARVPCHISQIEGDAETLLVNEAQKADLLVLGKKSVSEKPDQPATHVLQHVLRNAPRPILCVPAVASPSGAVLVAYDGSGEAAKALQAFQAVGLANRRSIHVLTVSNDPADRRFGEYAIEYLRLHGHDAQAHFESSTAPPGKVILAMATRLGAGLVVMGCHSKKALQEFFLGSIAKTVLKESTCPVLLYH